MTFKFFLFLTFSLFFGISSPALAQTNHQDETRIVIISDLNASYGSTEYGEYVDSALVFIEQVQPDLVLCTGDMIAGQKKELIDDDIRAMWEGFDRTVRQRLEKLGIPFAFTIGNHDGSASGSFDNERRIAKKYWEQYQPNVDFQNSERYPFLYSFIFDDLFILAWDASYHAISDKDREFVVNQLQSDAARSAQQRIVMGHLPLYAVAQGRNRRGEILADADSLHSLFEENDVDIYLSGHHHAWYPAEKDGVKLLAMGAQGNGPRQLIDSDDPPRRTITQLTFSNLSPVIIQTYDLENRMIEIKPDELPGKIEGVNGVIHRLNYTPKREVIKADS